MTLRYLSCNRLSIPWIRVVGNWMQSTGIPANCLLRCRVLGVAPGRYFPPVPNRIHEPNLAAASEERLDWKLHSCENAAEAQGRCYEASPNFSRGFDPDMFWMRIAATAGAGQQDPFARTGFGAVQERACTCSHAGSCTEISADTNPQCCGRADNSCWHVRKRGRRTVG